MSSEREQTEAASDVDFHMHPAEQPDIAARLESALIRMGATGIITVSSSDSDTKIDEQYKAVILAMVLNRAKELQQIYYWIPASEYKPEPKKRKQPAVRISTDGRSYAGVPLGHHFPKEGAKLMVQAAPGDMPFLQFLRNLREKPGHVVTFFRGELKQADFTYAPSGPAHPAMPHEDQSAEAPQKQYISPLQAPGIVSRNEDEKRRRELEIPRTIQLYYQLPQADRENIYYRMPPTLREAMDEMIFEDARGLHRRSNAELRGNPGTLHSRLLKAAQFIFPLIRTTKDGQVVREETNGEHIRRVLRSYGQPAGSDMAALLAPTENRSRKKNKRKQKGWH